jgi:hypothetical protein
MTCAGARVLRTKPSGPVIGSDGLATLPRAGMGIDHEHGNAGSPGPTAATESS